MNKHKTAGAVRGKKTNIKSSQDTQIILSQ